MYPENLVIPMKKELTDVGFKDLVSSDDVKAILSKNETTLIVVNSVCGCAAANARPGAIESLKAKPINKNTKPKIIAGLISVIFNSSKFRLPVVP